MVECICGRSEIDEIADYEYEEWERSQVPDERDQTISRLEAENAILRSEVARLAAALDAAVVAMRAARGVVVSKREHAALTGALMKAAEAKAGLSLPPLAKMNARAALERGNDADPS